MTTKTKLGMFAIAGIAAIIAISSGIMFNNETTLTSNNVQEIADNIVPVDTTTTVQSNTLVEPIITTLPHEQENRGGVPILTTIKMAIVPEDMYYHQINSDQADYLWRAVDNGATFITEKELDDYFIMFHEEGHRFAMNDGKTTEYYRITFSSAPLAVDQHYMQILELDEQRGYDFKSLDVVSKERLSLPLENPYRWVPMGESDTVAIRDKIAQENSFFSADGKVFQVIYLGPLSPELQHPDFAEMYPRLIEDGNRHE